MTRRQPDGSTGSNRPTAGRGLPIRSERAFCERLNYDLLFKRFLDLRIDQPAFDASAFSKNRQRLLDQDVADEFFAAVVRQAKLRRYISSDYFTVDGTLLEAWASHKSFKPKDQPPSEPPVGRNAEATSVCGVVLTELHAPAGRHCPSAGARPRQRFPRVRADGGR